MERARDTAPLPGREDLAAHTVEVLNRGNRRNPDVLLVESAGRRLVVKDFAPRGPWVRATLGRWITTRELRAWRALAGHPHVPAFLGRIDALAFAVEYRPGERLSGRLLGTLPAGFGERLAAALEEMHRRGVVHLDLRHRSNVLVGEDGEPILIDFGSAFCFRPGGLAARWLLPLLARLDRNALAKWRSRLPAHEAGPAAPDAARASPKAPAGPGAR